LIAVLRKLGATVAAQLEAPAFARRQRGLGSDGYHASVSYSISINQSNRVHAVLVVTFGASPREIRPI
jgi:hypothetical protein